MKLQSYFFRIAIFSFLFLIINSKAFAAPVYSTSYDLSGQDGSPENLIFNDDGTKMYMTGRLVNLTMEYSLTTGFDVTDVNFQRTFDQSGEEPVPSGITFNNDGTKFYVIGLGGGTIFEYDLSPAYDTNTAILNQAFPQNQANPSDIKFNNDGTKMYTVDSIALEVEEYDLTTAYDIQTADPGATRTYDFDGRVVDVQGIEFNNDGTKMFVADSTANTIYSYTLSTGFLVTSASYTASFDLTGSNQEVTSIAFNNDGTKMFVVDATTGDVEVYNMCAYSLTETMSFLD